MAQHVPPVVRLQRREVSLVRAAHCHTTRPNTRDQQIEGQSSSPGSRPDRHTGMAIEERALPFVAHRDQDGPRSVVLELVKDAPLEPVLLYVARGLVRIVGVIKDDEGVTHLDL
eukprot:6775188-Prymnesium_polylepis.1